MTFFDTDKKRYYRAMTIGYGVVFLIFMSFPLFVVPHDGQWQGFLRLLPVNIVLLLLTLYHLYRWKTLRAQEPPEIQLVDESYINNLTTNLPLEIRQNYIAGIGMISLAVAGTIWLWLQDIQLVILPSIQGEVLAGLFSLITAFLIFIVIHDWFINYKIIIKETGIILPGYSPITWGNITEIKVIKILFMPICLLYLRDGTIIKLRPHLLGKGWENIAVLWSQASEKT